MSKYIVYDIYPYENLKFSKTNMQIESEETMDYIPATAIRGAYIYKYISKNKIGDINEGIHREKLLKGKIKFLNAYPKYKEIRSIAFPRSYFAPKEEMKVSSEKIEVKSGLDRKLAPGYQNYRKTEFATIKDDGYISVNIEKISNLHINKMKGREKNKLFRYEAIKKGQVFQAIIKIEDKKDLKEVEELFKDEIVYLGGSKGSGYGKCRIRNMKVVDENPEYRYFENKGGFDKHIYLLALSDIIFRNEVGEYKTFIDEETLAKALNLKNVKYIDSSIDVKVITNFNNKWNCSTPAINAIKAGSVFKYSIEGKVDEEKLEKFLDQGIGERKQDGFGRFVILNNISDSIVYKNEGLEVLGKNKKAISVKNEDREDVKKIIDIIYEKRLRDSISQRVIEIDEKLVNTKDMSDSQWGSLKELFKSLIYEDLEDGIEICNKYIDNIKSKRSNSHRKTDKVNYKDGEKTIKLLEFFKKFVESSRDLKSFENELDREVVSIGNLKSSIDEDFLYRHKMEILSELCRYQIRKGES